MEQADSIPVSLCCRFAEVCTGTLKSRPLRSRLLDRAERPWSGSRMDELMRAEQEGEGLDERRGRGTGFKVLLSSRDPIERITRLAQVKGPEGGKSAEDRLASVTRNRRTCDNSFPLEDLLVHSEAQWGRSHCSASIGRAIRERERGVGMSTKIEKAWFPSRTTVPVSTNQQRILEQMLPIIQASIRVESSRSSRL